MRTARALAVVVAMIDPAHAADCVGSRLVAVGDGCVELWCDYRAVSSGWAMDIGGGYFEAKVESSRINWTSGSISYPLGVGLNQEIIWRRPAFHGWRFWWHALVATGDGRSYRVANHSLVLETTAATPDALDRLGALAASYARKANVSVCEQPEPLASLGGG